MKIYFGILALMIAGVFAGDCHKSFWEDDHDYICSKCKNDLSKCVIDDDYINQSIDLQLRNLFGPNYPGKWKYDESLSPEALLKKLNEANGGKLTLEDIEVIQQSKVVAQEASSRLYHQYMKSKENLQIICATCCQTPFYASDEECIFDGQLWHKNAATCTNSLFNHLEAYNLAMAYKAEFVENAHMFQDLEKGAFKQKDPINNEEPIGSANKDTYDES